jgi:hypothetical protein
MSKYKDNMSFFERLNFKLFGDGKILMWMMWVGIILSLAPIVIGGIILFHFVAKYW